MNTWSGDILVQKNPADDAAYLLGVSDWAQRFQRLTVDSETWKDFDALGFWKATNQQLNVMIDQYEEEWIKPEQLGKFRDLVAQFLSQRDAQLNNKQKPFLRNLMALSDQAIKQGVPIIFAF